MERQLLVFGSRNGGLRLLIVLHGTDLLAGVALGEPLGSSHSRPLSCGYSICGGTFHRGAPAQSFVCAGHSFSGVLS